MVITLSYVIHREAEDPRADLRLRSRNYWDPEKKQSRQKRSYLGIWDEATGQIIPKTAERDVKTTKSFGPSYLMDSVGNEIQIRKKLFEAFGKDGDSILAMAISKLLYQTSLKTCIMFWDDSFLPEMYSLKESKISSDLQ
jgi:hypothetical protein